MGIVALCPAPALKERDDSVFVQASVKVIGVFRVGFIRLRLGAEIVTDDPAARFKVNPVLVTTIDSADPVTSTSTPLMSNFDELSSETSPPAARATSGMSAPAASIPSIFFILGIALIIMSALPSVLLSTSRDYRPDSMKRPYTLRYAPLLG
jgi:hypothetical protein